MNRHPPTHLCQQLRREVNFGCPFKDCASPFLTFHHFDPTWNEQKHHEPGGMIALCLGHAALADNNLYSKVQLRELKRDPFVQHVLEAAWRWEPERLLTFLGPIAVFGTRPVLAVNGKDVLAISKLPIGDTGPDSVHVDVDLRDNLNAQVLSIRKNWLELRNLST